MYLRRHPENHLDAGTEPTERKGRQQQTSVCAQSERGNRHLNVTERSGKECILHVNGRDHEAVLMNVHKVTVCMGLLLGSVCSGPPHPLGLFGFCKRRLENYMGI